MTCIVGLISKGKVYIGGDSAGVNGYDIRVRADEKVFINGSMIFGFTTSFRMGQLLRYSLKVSPQLDNQNDYEFMVTTFIDDVRDCLKKGGYATKKDEVESGGTFLVGYKGNLYTISNDYQVATHKEGYASVGCGDSYALGALYNSIKVYNPKMRIENALETAEYFSGGVCKPFHIENI